MTGGCACVLGAGAGGHEVRRLGRGPEGVLSACGGDCSHAFGRPARPSARVMGGGGSKGGYNTVGYREGRTFAKHSNAKRDAACGSSALSGMRRGFLERVPSTS